MGEKLCWDRWKNIISGKIDSSMYTVFFMKILDTCYIRYLSMTNCKVDRRSTDDFFLWD